MIVRTNSKPNILSPFCRDSIYTTAFMFYYANTMIEVLRKSNLKG
jgi:hypothetical protein